MRTGYLHEAAKNFTVCFAATFQRQAVLRWRACSCPVFLLSLSPSPFADYTVLLLQLGRQQHLPATPASRNMSDRMDNHEQRETMHKLDDDDALRANMLPPATSTMLESSPRSRFVRSTKTANTHPSPRSAHTVKWWMMLATLTEQTLFSLKVH
jgi:hypothetical protein